MRLPGIGKPAAVLAGRDAVQARQPSGAPSLVQSAFLNTVVALLEYGTSVVVAALTTPLILAGLGSSQFGAWQVLKQLISYMGAADGRPATALKWIIANQQGADDDFAKRRAVGSSVQIWLTTLPILLLIGAVLIWLAPTMSHSEPDMAVNVRIAAGMLVLAFVVDGLVSIPTSVLRGMNQGYRRAGLNAGLPVLAGILSVVSIYLGAGLIGLGLAQLVVLVLGGVLFLRVVKRYVPWFGIDRPLRGEVRRFLGVSVWFLTWRLVNRALTASDVVLIGYLGSTTLASTYVITAFPLQAVVALLDAVVGSVTPGLGKMVGQARYEDAARVRAEGMKYSWILIVIMGACIAMWNQSFINLWVGPGHYAGTLVNFLLVILTIQLVFLRNDASIIDLTLDMRSKVLLGALAAAISAALAYLFIPTLGTLGLCIGLLVGRCILTISYPLLVMRRFGIKGGGDLVTALWRGLLSVLAIGAASYVGAEYQADSWLSLFVLAGATCAALCIIVVAVGLTQDERRQMLRRVRSLRAR